MTTDRPSDGEKPKSMIRADIANGEAPDPGAASDEQVPSTDDDSANHPSGSRQAKETQENDPPA